MLSLVASQVGKTERQLKYFMKKNGLRARYFDDITDDELDVLTLKIVSCFPTIGPSTIKCYLDLQTINNIFCRISHVLWTLQNVQSICTAHKTTSIIR
jgi:hypothetical protein